MKEVPHVLLTIIAGCQWAQELLQEVSYKANCRLKGAVVRNSKLIYTYLTDYRMQ